MRRIRGVVSRDLGLLLVLVVVMMMMLTMTSMTCAHLYL